MSDELEEFFPREEVKQAEELMRPCRRCDQSKFQSTLAPAPDTIYHNALLCPQCREEAKNDHFKAARCWERESAFAEAKMVGWQVIISGSKGILEHYSEPFENKEEAEAEAARMEEGLFS